MKLIFKYIQKKGFFRYVNCSKARIKFMMRDRVFLDFAKILKLINSKLDTATLYDILLYIQGNVVWGTCWLGVQDFNLER